MRIELHIGVDHCGAGRLQEVLSDKRDALTGKGVRYAATPGKQNHTKLWMAVTDPEHIDPLRFHRGYGPVERQAVLRDTLRRELAQEIATHKPEVLILSAVQLCWLASVSELERLQAFLSGFSKDIHVTAHIDEQSRVLTRLYGEQVLDGRSAALDQEITLAARRNWWADALKFAPDIDATSGVFRETQGAAFWLDYAHLVQHWESVFGAGRVRLRAYDAKVFAGETLTDEICASFRLTQKMGKARVAEAEVVAAPSAAWLARGRQLNEMLLKLLSARQHNLPRNIWRSCMDDMRVDGAPIDAGSLGGVSRHFEPANAGLIKAHPGLTSKCLAPPPAAPGWEEADPTRGFRASQYLLAFLWRIEKAAQAAEKTEEPIGAQVATGEGLSEIARAIMPPLAVQNFEKLRNSAMKPHNRIGVIRESDALPPYPPVARAKLQGKRCGNVVVGCMKNEAPYIVEWIAYHRAIGIDSFLIYTNDCSDGTDRILERLGEMGVLEHRNNDTWSGNSPQQFALDQALGEPVVRHADWVAHIDVDEFMNIRCGNGTMTDLLERVPDATNIAMTWRLFGHNGVTDLRDDLVIDQFETCAPKFCPKPHTVWGFKTLFKNTGAYGKFSCHRPNKLNPKRAGEVKWVNGSGRDMTKEALHNGWRNSRKSIGYDLIQLNHYALRSAESFLIKRQRGRALHVDRSIGLNYWIRMDWSDHRDLTIKRNLPRVRAEYDRLMQDETLRTLHANGLAWHRAKARELRAMEEFRDLYDQALRVKLSAPERVAYALALDMET